MRVMAAIALASSLCITAAHADVTWFHGTWPQALHAARTEKRPIVADFYSWTCAPCVRMDKTTFADSTVAMAMRDFVAFRLDGFTPEGRQVTASLKVSAWPTLVVFDSTGNELDRHIGYLSATAYLAEIHRILAGEGTIPDLRARAAAQPENAQLLYALGLKQADRRDPGARQTLLRAVEASRAAGSGPADSAWWAIADVAREDSAFALVNAAYESLLVCCPRSPYAEYVKENLPDSYHALGQDSLAVSLLREAVRLHPEDASKVLILGQSLWDWRIDRDEGVRLVREAVRRDTSVATNFLNRRRATYPGRSMRSSARSDAAARTPGWPRGSSASCPS